MRGDIRARVWHSPWLVVIAAVLVVYTFMSGAVFDNPDLWATTAVQSPPSTHTPPQAVMPAATLQPRVVTKVKVVTKTRVKVVRVPSYAYRPIRSTTYRRVTRAPGRHGKGHGKKG